VRDFNKIRAIKITVIMAVQRYLFFCLKQSITAGKSITRNIDVILGLSFVPEIANFVPAGTKPKNWIITIIDSLTANKTKNLFMLFLFINPLKKQ
jgi:hypothetical protein